MDVMKISKGNPGALSVIRRLLVEKHELIAAASLVNLELRGIVGSLIWVAYKDVCGQDLEKLLDRLEELDDSFQKEVIEAAR